MCIAGQTVIAVHRNEVGKGLLSRLVFAAPHEILGELVLFFRRSGGQPRRFDPGLERPLLGLGLLELFLSLFGAVGLYEGRASRRYTGRFIFGRCRSLSFELAKAKFDILLQLPDIRQ